MASAYTPARLLSTREVCERLAVGRTSLWKLTRTGQLPARRIGRLVRYAEIDIERFIEALNEVDESMSEAAGRA